LVNEQHIVFFSGQPNQAVERKVVTLSPIEKCQTKPIQSSPKENSPFSGLLMIFIASVLNAF
jgi:hypothetical protein